MNINKKWLFIILLLVLVPILAISLNKPKNIDTPTTEKTDTSLTSKQNNVLGETADSTVIYFFWGEGCPHCSVQKPFLEEMERKYPELEVKMYETWYNNENAELFQKMAKAYGIQAQGVPTTFIGNLEPVVGFIESMKTDMENDIKNCIEQGCINPASKL